jgi:hypothetical protein
MDLLGSLLQGILNDPKMQAVAFGLVVKIVVDYLKKEFVVLDAQGEKAYKVPVQAIVAICSMLASLGDLYLHSQLQTFDMQTLITFVTVTLPVYLSAMGFHLIHTDVKKSVK